MNTSYSTFDMKGERLARFWDTLSGDIYIHLNPNRRNYLMLRLDSFLSDGDAQYSTKNLTIEHVLPQTIPTGSEWATVWPDKEDRTKWVHKLANLVPLNRRRNSSAQNYPFTDKKKKYFSGRTNVSSYALTSQVNSEVSWTKEVLEKRQQQLLMALETLWKLT